MWVRSLGWEDPQRRAWQPTPVFLPGESHGQRSLVGYSPWVRQSQTQLKQLRIRARGRWKRHQSRVHLDPDQDPVTGEW